MDQDSYLEGEFTPVAEPDMRLFPPAAERALRFLSSGAINQAIASTTGPIEVVTVGAGFPWIAAMQANEHHKRCDSTAKQMVGAVKAKINDKAIPSVPEATENDEHFADEFRSTALHPTVGLYLRTVLGDTLFDPPATLADRAITTGKRHKLAASHLIDSLTTNDALASRANEPDEVAYRGRGGWETVVYTPSETLDEALRHYFVERWDMPSIRTHDQAQRTIQVLGHMCANELPPVLRSFRVRALDTVSSAELMDEADAIYAKHRAVRETQLFRAAAEIAQKVEVQADDYDLSSLDDDSASVIIVSHWPLRHKPRGEAGDANWAPLVEQIHRKLTTNGVAIFFPWSLPGTFEADHPEMTLGGVQSMMVNEYKMDVSVAGEPVADLLRSIAIFGQEPALLAPQMRAGGMIGRLIALKRKTLSDLLPD